MEEKKCKSCSAVKNIGEFYPHKNMKDGYLSKCIKCINLESNLRYKKNIQDKEYRDRLNALNRQKYKDGKKKYKPSYEQRKKTLAKFAEKYPEKLRAQSFAQNMPKKDGYHLHHWSYNEEHYKDVIELKKEEHYIAHRFIVYDQERKMYRRSDNNILLDSKESHHNYIIEKINQEIKL